MTDKPYRRNVAAILRRADGKIMMAERIGKPDSWQFPQGGVDKGENHEEALWREMEEELGLSPIRDFCRILAKTDPITYDFPAELTSKITRKYKGQAQVVYLLDFQGTDADFQLDAHDEPEFQSIRWIHPHEAPPLIWEVKRHIVVEALKVFAPHL